MNLDETNARRNEQALTKKVLDFWIGEEGSKIYGTNRKEWFVKDPDFDNQIREKFSEDVEIAIDGGYGRMAENQMGCLALVILPNALKYNFERTGPNWTACFFFAFFQCIREKPKRNVNFG